MSEKTNKSPEATQADIEELYAHAALLLRDSPERAVMPTGGAGTLEVTAPIGVFNGKRYELTWMRPSVGDDPTKVDDDAPVQYDYPVTESEGWHTPIDIRAYDEKTGEQVHDFTVTNRTEKNAEQYYPANAFDNVRMPDDYDPALHESVMAMTTLEAHELTAHIDAARTGQFV